MITSKDRPVYVLGACRTPMGRFGGAFRQFSAAQLGQVVAAHLLASMAEPSLVEEVIFGQVFSAGSGMNVARQIALGCGLPERTPAYTVNKVCASGMKAITLGARAIASGEGDLLLAGGVESMSQTPFLIGAEARWGRKMGDLMARDSMIADGLTDPTHRVHMALLAEALGERLGVSREEQDAFALQSQQRWKAAASAGAFSQEIVPVELSEGGRVEDETARPDSTYQGLQALKPVFSAEGTITAGNASGLADGAAALLLASEEGAKRAGVSPLARLTAWCSVGLAPADMGLGPVVAMRKLFAATKTAPDHYQLLEINEAFAVQVLSCLRELPLPGERLNVHGGAIALGHALGCSGARIVVTLLHALLRRGERSGLASLCVGGGMGMALAIECRQ